jgi:hypothetical protein
MSGACALHAGYITIPIPRLCNRHCFSTATMVTRTCFNATLYVHCLSCFVLELQHRTKICNWSAHILSNATACVKT